MVSEDGLRAAKEKMQAEGVPDAAIATFEHYYEQLVAGESGMLPDADLEQLEDIPEAGTTLNVAGHPVEILQVQNRMVKVVRILPRIAPIEDAQEAA